MGVVDRVHGDSAHLWTETHPAASARFAPRLVLVLGVGHLPDRRHGMQRHAPHLLALHAEQRQVVLRVALHHLCRGTRSPAELPPLARVELDVVNHGAYWNEPKLHGVARLDVEAHGLGGAHHLPHSHATRAEDV
eukprot:CAMPEP_0173389086 /NCGR_PEP_ID=MMETSP1356-20130122/11233_1 /TAXON_ID=77927 ORGANISM="Hemiselmis virescens, Strain PCC157" /NCGR_SAMPLE_ID=MMETSP1356 /ASSEMBLY_ACC=CAM_ASM_000847 /LENGTH=134 /DNA_ID=CAMNT_0014346143 /DNA_START=562 /DNA_END=966 /DNA_ORIENTATION=+